MTAVKRVVLASVLALAGLCLVEACNEAVCGPLVSKCMLINCCDCEMTDLKNCSCCRECQICLSKLYTECCSCVGMCPPPDVGDELERSSSVEDLSDPIPDLFNVLTKPEEQGDYNELWTTFTYAVDLDKLFLEPGFKKPGVEIKVVKPGDGQPNYVEESTGAVYGIRNCTVAFFSNCMPIGKCKASCKSMGANKYRWFHEHGCCECIGSTCHDYGLSKPNCLNCPKDKEVMIDDQPYSWADYSGKKHV